MNLFHRRTRAEYLIPALFVVAGAAWSVLSDEVMWQRAAGDAGALHQLSAYEDWFFIAITAVILHLLLRSALARERALERDAADSESRYRALLEASPDAVLVQQGDRFVYANAAAVRLLGAPSAASLIGRIVTDFVDAADAAAVLDRSSAVQEGRAFPGTAVRRMRRVDGSRFRAESSVAAVRHEGAPALLVRLRDVTEAARLEDELRRVNGALRLLGACNEAIFRATDERALLAEICRLFVDQGGYALAWAGRVENDPERSIRPVAWHGRDDGSVAGLRLTWAEGAPGHGSTGEAVRSGRPAVTNDLEGAPGFAPWREEARRRGFAASAALPVQHGDERVAVLGVYAAEPDVFDPAVVQILSRLADDLAFGVVSLRTRTVLLQVLDHAPMPVYVTSRDRKFLVVNRAWEQTTGIPRARAVGRPVREILPEVEAAQDAVGRVLATGQTERQLEAFSFQGTIFSYDTIRFPLLGPDGEVYAVGGLSVDVTARREAEETLRAERAFLQTVLDNAGVIVGVVDRDGRIVRANRHFEVVTGRPVRELEGASIYEVIVHPDEAARVRPNLSGVWEGAFPQVLVNDVVTAAGRRTFEWTNTLLPGADGSPALLVGIGHDVTERLEADEKLRESREQLRALAARIQAAREEEKARIARDLHDELGQLLTGVKMDLRWLERRVGELPPSPETNALLDRAVAASALADLTAQTVQRIATDLRPGALDRLGLAAALRQEGRKFEERTGITCSVSLGDDGAALAPDGATTLYRIAQEAMTNVARHAGAQRVDLALLRAGDAIVLRVEDDGHGIAADAPSRADALGLLGMKERAAMLGGDVIVERRPAGGTCVVARLPVARPGGEA